MAIKVRLDCKKAFSTLQSGAYKVHVPLKAVKIYVPDGTHIDVYGRSMSLARLATILIEGTAHIPPRPFITDAVTVLNVQLRQILRAHSHIRKTRNRHSGRTDVWVELDSDTVATESEVLIKRWLFNGYYCAVVPNAKKTIQHKGFNLPLVETGQLVNSITAKVVLGWGKY